jgi:hypothetical protein
MERAVKGTEDGGARGQRVYRFAITDVETQTPVFQLQWLLDRPTLEFLVADLCYQLSLPVLPLKDEGNEQNQT